MSELKACPFCGSDANIEYDETYGDTVTCSNSKCKIFASFLDEFDVDDWNNRPIEDAQAARIAELEKALGLASAKLNEVASELCCYIDMKNADLELNIRCDDIDPPDYHDAQTSHECGVMAMQIDLLLKGSSHD